MICNKTSYQLQRVLYKWGPQQTTWHIHSNTTQIPLFSVEWKHSIHAVIEDGIIYVQGVLSLHQLFQLVCVTIWRYAIQ